MEPNYRRCLSCRKVAPKSSFWRIIRVYPSRKVQLDEGMGRSAYICPRADCLAAAQKKNRLARSLRVSVPEGIYETLWQRLASPPAFDGCSQAAKKNSDPSISGLNSSNR